MQHSPMPRMWLSKRDPLSTDRLESNPYPLQCPRPETWLESCSLALCPILQHTKGHSLHSLLLLLGQASRIQSQHRALWDHENQETHSEWEELPYLSVPPSVCPVSEPISWQWCEWELWGLLTSRRGALIRHLGAMWPPLNYLFPPWLSFLSYRTRGIILSLRC